MTVASLLLIVVAVVLLAVGLLGGSNTYLVASILASLLAAIALIAGTRRQMHDDSDDAADAATRGRRRSRKATLVRTGAAGGRDADDPDDDVEPGARDTMAAEDDDDLDDDEVERFDAPAYARRPEAPAVDEYSDRDDVARSAVRETAVIELDRPGLPHQSGPNRDDTDPYVTDFGSGRHADRARDLDDTDDRYDTVRAEAPNTDADDEFDDEDPPDEPPAQYVSSADAAKVARMSSEVVVVDGRPRYHLPACRHLVGREYEALPVSEAVDLGFTPCSRCEPDSALLAYSRRV